MYCSLIRTINRIDHTHQRETSNGTPRCYRRRAKRSQAKTATMILTTKAMISTTTTTITKAMISARNEAMHQQTLQECRLRCDNSPGLHSPVTPHLFPEALNHRHLQPEHALRSRRRLFRTTGGMFEQGRHESHQGRQSRAQSPTQHTPCLTWRRPALKRGARAQGGKEGGGGGGTVAVMNNDNEGS